MEKTGKFQSGDLIILTDPKGRKYFTALKKGGKFHSHLGFIPHDEIIGSLPGQSFISSKGSRVIVFKAGLEDYIMKMKRGAQIIYPKDIGLILTLLDVFPGAKVFEVGAGSGAATIYLLRAVGRKGKIFSYETRADFFEIAKNNIETFHKANQKEEWGRLFLKNQDVFAGIEEKDFNRALIDLPEPWEMLEILKKITAPGAKILSYLPTALQIYRLADAVEKDFANDFYIEGIYENLLRPWQKRGLALRPKDRMTAHTGFLVVFKKTLGSI